MSYQLLTPEELAKYPPIAIEFQHTMMSILGRSSRTVSEYLLDLRMFFKYLTAQDLNLNPLTDPVEECPFHRIDFARLARVERGDIIAYLFYLTEIRRNSAVTRNRKISALRSFYKFLVRYKGLEHNPTEKIDGPKKRTSLPKFLNLDESLSLLDIVGRSDSPTKRRDYAILILFLNCGMRLSELTGINLSDLKNQYESLRVVGKGNKERIVYLNDACRTALLDYMTERMDGTPEKMREKALFLSSRNKRISNKTVQWMVYKYLDAAGLRAPGMSVHKLRHTAATLMYQTGRVDVRVLKEILGHEQLNTTQIYTHVTNRNMQDAVMQNPLASTVRHDPVADVIARVRAASEAEEKSPMEVTK